MGNNMLPDLHPTKASMVASHSLPNIIGCHPAEVLGWRTKKYTGYSHESMEIITSSSTLFSLTLYLSINSRIVGVGWKFGSSSCFMVCKVMILMVSLRLINVFS